MRFYIFFIVAVCCASCVGAAVASPPLSTAGVKSASVRVLDCDRYEREAVFRAAMRRVPSTQRMRLRFTLLQREPGERFARVRAPGLNRWKRSRRGVRRFAHRQRVRGLNDGFDYRARVEFQWLDSDGDVIRRRRSSSRTCSLVDQLPNLKVTFVAGVPEGIGERYTVGVENAGRADSPETSLRLGVDGKGQGFAPVPSLAPGESTTVSLAGERCAIRVRAFADPGQLVTESREGDNAFVRSCP